VLLYLLTRPYVADDGLEAVDDFGGAELTRTACDIENCLNFCFCLNTVEFDNNCNCYSMPL